MANAIVPLMIAIVGVVGTCASAILTQRQAQKSRITELRVLEEQRLADREATERRQGFEERKGCSVRLASGDRNYRDALLAYAYALARQHAPQTEAKELAEARRAQRDVRAEAQLLLSDQVLQVEGEVNDLLTEAYGGLKLVEREDDLSVRKTQLADVIADLDGIVGLLHRVHAAMRYDLGIITVRPDWY